MIKKWVCVWCESLNEIKKESCCGCDKSKGWSQQLVVVVTIDGKENISKLPSFGVGGISSVGLTSKSDINLAKCPSCNMLMYCDDNVCPHCAHQLTEHEILTLAEQNPASIKNIIVGVLIWGILIYGFYAYVQSYI
jgi:predicted amidophosphoribosyltransferase